MISDTSWLRLPFIPLRSPCSHEAQKVLTRPQEQTILWGSLARAAAGAQKMEIYTAARDKALEMVERYPEHKPAMLRNVAYAAQLVEEWESRRTQRSRQRNRPAYAAWKLWNAHLFKRWSKYKSASRGSENRSPRLIITWMKSSGPATCGCRSGAVPVAAGHRANRLRLSAPNPTTPHALR